MLVGYRASMVLFFTASLLFANSEGETVKAFFERPLYAQPIATVLGTGATTGWYQSASVDEGFGWGVSLPISLIFINKSDRQYSDTYYDQACTDCRAQAAIDPSVQCYECAECTDFIAPTFLGTIRTPNLTSSVISANDEFSINPYQYKEVDPPFVTGISEAAQYDVIPFATLQGMVSLYHTALTVRYIGIPKIGGLSFQLPGVGLQHDFTRFLPPMPLSLSAAGNVTFLNVSWKLRGDNNEGTLTLNGVSNFIGLLAGSRLGAFDMFAELGWEHSYLKPGGDVHINGEALTFTKSIPGRNGFRCAINIALPVVYNPVVGLGGGAQFATQLTVLGVKSRKK